MENDKDFDLDFDFIKAQFDSLPAVTLPASLTSESLWVRMDTQDELAANTTKNAPKEGKAIAFVRRFRPVLSYAAVFLVMVAVYYSAGLDSSPVAIQQDMAAPRAAVAENPAGEPMVMMASPEMTDESEMADAPDPAPQTAPRMVDATGEAPSGATTKNADTASNESGDYDALSNDNYQKAIENAVAMENYMVASLSAKDYGGIYVGTEETVRLHIWVVNDNAVAAAVAAYTGEFCEVVTQPARCSIAQMKGLVGKLESIALEQGETLAAYVSQWDNKVAVNVSKTGEARLRGAAEALVQRGDVPVECVSIFTVDPMEENPGS